MILLTLAFFAPLMVKAGAYLAVSEAIPANVLSSRPLWKVLFFGDYEGVWRWGYLVLGVALVAYNLGRLWLTLQVSGLREREGAVEAFGGRFRPVDGDLASLWRVHRCLSVLFWLGFLTALYRVCGALVSPVPF